MPYDQKCPLFGMIIMFLVIGYFVLMFAVPAILIAFWKLAWLNAINA